MKRNLSMSYVRSWPHGAKGNDISLRCLYVVSLGVRLGYENKSNIVYVRVMQLARTSAMLRPLKLVVPKHRRGHKWK